MAVKITGLAQAVADALEEFQEETMADVKASVKDAAKACVKELHTTSPELTGSYRSGWQARTAYDGPLDIRLQVYNKTDYQLTHLLEDGHANVDGGRTPAYPHIGPAAENAADLLGMDVTMKVGRK